VFATRRRRTVTEARTAVDPASGEQVTRRSTQDGGGPVV